MWNNSSFNLEIVRVYLERLFIISVALLHSLSQEEISKSPSSSEAPPDSPTNLHMSSLVDRNARDFGIKRLNGKQKCISSLAASTTSSHLQNEGKKTKNVIQSSLILLIEK